MFDTQKFNDKTSISSFSDLTLCSAQLQQSLLAWELGWCHLWRGTQVPPRVPLGAIGEDEGAYAQHTLPDALERSQWCGLYQLSWQCCVQVREILIYVWVWLCSFFGSYYCYLTFDYFVVSILYVLFALNISFLWCQQISFFVLFLTCQR